MSLNPAGTTSYHWNYSNPNKEGYSEDLVGTVVAMQEVQAREFSMTGQPGRPAFWPDGNPKMNIRIAFAMQDGSLKTITFQRAGRKQVSGEKPSLHMQLFKLTNNNMEELMGKTIFLRTWPTHPETGQRWGQGNPRLFAAQEVENDTPYQLSFPLPEEFKVPQLYANDAVSGGQPQPAMPQQIQTPTVQYQQPVYQQPQPVMQQPVYQQPVQQMPVQAGPQPQPQQATTAQIPAGMDPTVAAAMQAVGATNIQPVEPYADDGSIPF